MSKKFKKFRQARFFVTSVPENIDVGGFKPTRVWTILDDAKPTLPMVPVHNVNAFLEDFMHDWNWRNAKLRYSSRVTEGNNWILCEWESNE